jgi:hypothetical protein
VQGLDRYCRQSIFNTVEPVVDQGSFAAAAGQVCRSQPAITQRIQRLEASIGVRFFGKWPRQAIDRRWRAAAGLCSSNTARSIEMLEPDFRVVGTVEGLPPLPDVSFYLYIASLSAHPTARRLFEVLRTHFRRVVLMFMHRGYCFSRLLSISPKLARTNSNHEGVINFHSYHAMGSIETA